MPLTVTVTTREITDGEIERSRDNKAAKINFTLLCNQAPVSLVELETAAIAGGLAEVGDLLDAGDTRRCSKVAIKKDAKGGSLNWTASAEYELWTNDGSEGSDDPLEVLDTYAFDCDSEQLEIFEGTVVGDEGAGDVPIVTTAGEPFSKQPTVTAASFKIIIVGNRATVDWAAWVPYLYPKSAINDANFTVRGLTINQYQGKLLSISAEPQIENDIPYFKVKWTIALAPSWNITPDNRGYFQLQFGDPDDLVPIVAGNPPQRVTKPWPLDLTGAGKPYPSDAPENRTFIVYTPKDFSIFDWDAA